jgi:hypothetical protein
MQKMIAAALVCAAMFGCGGGGSSGSDTTPPAITGSPAGLFHGTTSNGRSASAIVLDNGEYWIMYRVAGIPTLIAGAEQGHATFADGNFTSPDLKDFNLEGAGISNGTVTGTYVPKSRIAGSVVFTSSVVTFSATYDPSYDLPASQALVAGNYIGMAAVLAGTEPATLTISSTGALSGVSQSGCRFSGTALASPTGNTYAVRVTFAGGVCSNGTSTVTGVAYYDSGTSRVYSAALNSGRTNGFIFAGGK